MKLTECQTFDAMKDWSKLERAWAVIDGTLTEAMEIRPYFENGRIKARAHVFLEIDGRIITDVHVDELYTVKAEAMRAVKKKDGKVYHVELYRKMFSDDKGQDLCWGFVVEVKRKQDLTPEERRSMGKVVSWQDGGDYSMKRFAVDVESVLDVEKAMKDCLEAADQFLSETIGKWEARKERFQTDREWLLMLGKDWPKQMKTFGCVGAN